MVLFFSHSPKSQAQGFTTFCLDAYISLRRLQKKSKCCHISCLQLVSLSLAVCVSLRACVCGSVWLPVAAYIHRDRERCSDSMREVHGCVMKPIITGWETGIVHAIDKSLSVTSSVFCQRPVFLSFFFSSQKAVHFLLLHENTKASLSWIGSVRRDNAWFAFNSWIWQAAL